MQLSTIQTTNDIDSECIIPLNRYITVDYVNNSFFVFDEEDVTQLRNNWRIIAQTTVSTSDQSSYFLTPEQVAVLVLYGAVRVREPDETSSELQKDSTQVKEASANINTIESGEGPTEATGDGICDKPRVIEFKKIDLNENQYHWLDDFDVPLPCSRDHRAREIVFHDLWRKGYYLTSGEQYGCAYLLYEGLPGEVHAKYLLDYVMEEEDLAVANVISLIRVATQVKKNLLLAVVASDSHHPHYLTFDWFKPYSKEFE